MLKRKVGFGPGFMINEEKVALVRQIADLAKPYFLANGYELVILDYFQGLPTRAPLKELAKKLKIVIEEENLYAIASHSMCNAMVRSLAADLEEFSGPIILFEGPNTASKFQIARWALHGKRRPFKYPCELDMVNDSPFMKSLTEKSLGMMPPLEIGGRASVHWYTKSAFQALPYTAYVQFPDADHLKMLYDPRILTFAIKFLNNPQAVISYLSQAKSFNRIL
ncbi:MAG TPA: hypothetical protein P5080_01220 [Candidatus Paceibacterota bacterium]|nr:hypothetical protein [Candidatus Pacearchaeota archaeon]HRZ50593.1 hypothetical protein [Candidatus Paceibacterota bacterium]HSA36314.1 hypothetical protein [Candidatus Paceibacterota bacterium]